MLICFWAAAADAGWAATHAAAVWNYFQHWNQPFLVVKYKYKYIDLHNQWTDATSIHPSGILLIHAGRRGAYGVRVGVRPGRYSNMCCCLTYGNICPDITVQLSNIYMVSEKYSRGGVKSLRNKVENLTEVFSWITAEYYYWITRQKKVPILKYDDCAINHHHTDPWKYVKRELVNEKYELCKSFWIENISYSAHQEVFTAARGQWWWGLKENEREKSNLKHFTKVLLFYGHY